MKRVKAIAVGIGPGPREKGIGDFTPDRVCAALAAWAEAASVTTAAEGERRSDSNTGRLVVLKSDLLNRLIYGGEKGPSQTPCPVHQGRWSGMHWGWPGALGHGEQGETPAKVEPHLQAWWDQGCRCAAHRGSSCTTGWNPDAACGCLDAAEEENEALTAALRAIVGEQAGEAADREAAAGSDEDAQRDSLRPARPSPAVERGEEAMLAALQRHDSRWHGEIHKCRHARDMWDGFAAEYARLGQEAMTDQPMTAAGRAGEQARAALAGGER